LTPAVTIQCEINNNYRKKMMKAAIVVMLLTMFLGGCGKGADPREELNKLQAKPGYREARIFCAQCHKLPAAEQHVSAAWPAVIERMEGHMKANNRKIPTGQDRAAIIGFFQSSPP
jgi:hypothetical protein